MISTKTLLLAPMWGFAIMSAIVSTFIVGPDLEERLFPIISDQSYSGAVRTADYACWQWLYTKNRNVDLVRKSLYIERSDGIRFPAAEMRPDLGMPSNTSTTAAAGVTRVIPECVSIPASLRAEPSFVVTGVNVYRPWHRLWNIDQPVVPVIFVAAERSSVADVPTHP